MADRARITIIIESTDVEIFWHGETTGKVRPVPLS